MKWISRVGLHLATHVFKSLIQWFKHFHFSQHSINTSEEIHISYTSCSSCISSNDTNQHHFELISILGTGKILLKREQVCRIAVLIFVRTFTMCWKLRHGEGTRSFSTQSTNHIKESVVKTWHLHDLHRPEAILQKGVYYNGIQLVIREAKKR